MVDGIRIVPGFQDDRSFFQKFTAAALKQGRVAILDLPHAVGLTAVFLAVLARSSKVVAAAVTLSVCAGSYIIRQFRVYLRVASEESELKKRLVEWCRIADTQPGEKKNEVADKIWSCFIYAQEKLSLKGLQLTSLPAVLTKLTHLKQLDLSDNFLTGIPNFLAQLRDCSILAGNNRLTLTKVQEFQRAYFYRWHAPASGFTYTVYEQPPIAPKKFTMVPNPVEERKLRERLSTLNFKARVTDDTIAGLRSRKEMKDQQISSLEERFQQLKASILELQGGVPAADDDVQQPPLSQQEESAGHSQPLDLVAVFDPLGSLRYECLYLEFTIGQQERIINGLEETVERLEGRISNLESSIEQSEQILADLLQAQRDTPPPPVIERNPLLLANLESWYYEFGEIDQQTGDLDQFLALSQPLLEHPGAGNLFDFLSRVPTTAGYNRDATKIGVIATVKKIIEAAVQNEEFREKMFCLAYEATESCEDRITLYLNKIEIWRRICCDLKKAPLREFCLFALGYKRLALLDEIVKKKLTEREIKDDIEVLAFYQLVLRDSLSLPLATGDIKYAGSAAQTPYNPGGITVQELGEARGEILRRTSSDPQIHTILCEPWPESNEWVDLSTLWHEQIKANNQERFQDIDAGFYKKLEQIPDDLTSGEYRNRMDAIMREKEKSHLIAVKSLTWTLIHGGIASKP